LEDRIEDKEQRQDCRFRHSNVPPNATQIAPRPPVVSGGFATTPGLRRVLSPAPPNLIWLSYLKVEVPIPTRGVCLTSAAAGSLGTVAGAFGRSPHDSVSFSKRRLLCEAICSALHFYPLPIIAVGPHVRPRAIGRYFNAIADPTPTRCPLTSHGQSLASLVLYFDTPVRCSSHRN